MSISAEAATAEDISDDDVAVDSKVGAATAAAAETVIARAVTDVTAVTADDATAHRRVLFKCVVVHACKRAHARRRINALVSVYALVHAGTRTRFRVQKYALVSVSV